MSVIGMLGIEEAASFSSKMGKCFYMKHFLNFRRISPENPQDKEFIPLKIKKYVSPVSPVSTVSFELPRLVM